MLLFYLFLCQRAWDTGGHLNENQSKFDVQAYDVDLKVHLDQKRLAGHTNITLLLLDSLQHVELDLIQSMEVTSVKNGDKQLDFQHEQHLLKIELPQPEPRGQLLKIHVEFSGTPLEATRPPWVGGFNWSKNKAGEHWVGLSCQGEGPMVWFPSVNHHADEPNKVDLRISVPNPYGVVANGLLKQTFQSEPNWTTYHWQTNYPTNNYNININIAKYKQISQQYEGKEGTFPVTYYYINEHTEHAEQILNMTVEYLAFFETHIGPYPWSKEKLGVVDTAYLGMEHQTVIAYGNQFRYQIIQDHPIDFLLLHEMAHEWFGNQVTVGDWTDFWIHEGLGSYMEALFVESKFGMKAYHRHIGRSRIGIQNRSPIVLHKNASEEEVYANSDIYSKGAFFAHSLRFLMGDEAFKNMLKDYVAWVQPEYLTSTNQFYAVMERHNASKWWPFADQFLKSTTIPRRMIEKKGDNYLVWLEDSPSTLPMEVETSYGIERFVLGPEPIEIKSQTKPVVDPNGWFLLRR